TFAGVEASVPDANYPDGPAKTASFNKPYGVAVDTDGNVFVADTGNHLIRKISANGMVTTVAGVLRTPGGTDGPVATAKFNSPTALTVASNGDLYVADT